MSPKKNETRYSFAIYLNTGAKFYIVKGREWYTDTLAPADKQDVLVYQDSSTVEEKVASDLEVFKKEERDFNNKTLFYHYKVQEERIQVLEALVSDLRRCFGDRS